MRKGLLAALSLLAVPIAAQGATNTTRIGPADGNTDVRTARPVAPANPGAVAALRARLGADAVVSVDDRNGALRMVGRLNGFLTPASNADPADIALGYVRANRAAFGLSAADLANLVLVRRVTSVGGLQRLFWQQRVRGVPALDSGLRANVTKNGRLINIAGSPVSGLQSVRVTPRLTAGQARVAALGGVGVAAKPSVARPTADARSSTAFASGDSAALGVLAGARNSLVWDTTVKVDTAHTYRVVVDATTGRTLLRRNLTQHASARIHRYYPGAPEGGTRDLVSIPSGWVTSTTALTGPNVHAFADLNDNDVADAGEETPPSTPPDVWNYALTTFADTIGGGPAGACTAGFPCTWDPTDVTTAAVNKNQNVSQVFYFVNNFHDWLARTPFGFTAANGNFEGDDAVAAQALDGANPPVGPNADHIDNANMSTPADGTAPTMQMYLFHQPGLPWGLAAGQDPFLPSNGGDSADIIYHEYTHGLSNRLVIDSLGNSTLNSQQAGSMGEAWSDWYAFDYLADNLSCAPVACEPDSATAGELLVGKYVSVGEPLIRTQAIDCPVAAVAALCAAPGPGVPAGGYTYGDLGKILGFPEVHADGEIWAQTLWDLRGAIGADLTRNLVTRGMELSPDDPSFLDMRNAILQADTALNGGAAHDDIWDVFAHRGMGYFAGSLDSGDVQPVESFALPPAAGTPEGVVSGTVIDTDTHAPAAGARVSFAGLDSGFPGNAGAPVDATGKYTLPALPIGTYPYLVAGGAGYEPAIVSPFTLVAGAQTSNHQPRRGWALASGGGAITAFTGTDNSAFGCGPSGLIDGKLGSGWGSDLLGGPPTITIKLPASVNVKTFGIDPGATCGDPADAGTQAYRVETSTNGTTFTVAAEGSFALADGGRLNEIAPTAGGTNVQYVRFTALSNFGNADDFIDVSELSVHGFQPGAATATITGPANIQLGKTTIFTSASSIGIAGSPIIDRTWSRTGVAAKKTVTYRLRGTKRGQRFTFSLRVKDFAGRVGTATKTVKVVDTLGPDVTIVGNRGRIGKLVRISGRLSDPSGLARTAFIRFGDGTSRTVRLKNGTFSARHRFRGTRTYIVQVNARDKLRNLSRTTKRVSIHE